MAAQPQRPKHAVNITVYHVGQKKFMNSLTNMNSGDAWGDAGELPHAVSATQKNKITFAYVHTAEKCEHAINLLCNKRIICLLKQISC